MKKRPKHKKFQTSFFPTAPGFRFASNYTINYIVYQSIFRRKVQLPSLLSTIKKFWYPHFLLLNLNDFFTRKNKWTLVQKD